MTVSNVLGMVSWQETGPVVFQVVLFALLGLLLFGAAFWVVNRLTAFSLRKELLDDQNTALAIVIAAVLLGIALIVAASIHG